MSQDDFLGSFRTHGRGRRGTMSKTRKAKHFQKKPAAAPSKEQIKFWRWLQENGYPEAEIEQKIIVWDEDGKPFELGADVLLRSDRFIIGYKGPPHDRKGVMRKDKWREALFRLNHWEFVGINHEDFKVDPDWCLKKIGRELETWRRIRDTIYTIKEDLATDVLRQIGIAGEDLKGGDLVAYPIGLKNDKCRLYKVKKNE